MNQIKHIFLIVIAMLPCRAMMAQDYLLDHYYSDDGVFFLATEDGKQAKVRPLGAHIEWDGKEYFTVGDFKAVYCQMVANPLVEIVAFTPRERKWLRYTGKAVFVENDEIVEQVFEYLPHLRKAYSPESGHKMMIFTLDDATARIIDMAGNEEII